MFGLFKARRRRRLLAEPLPANRREILRRRVRHFPYLPAAQQERVVAIVQVMLGEKEWAAAVGFDVTDEMRVTIAGYAAVMVSGVDPPYFYDRLETIVIHPDTVRFAADQSVVNPLASQPGALDGVAWQRGPVLVSWAAVRDERRGRPEGSNVVIHEFAHHLDGLNGEMDGIPPLGREAEARWREVAEQERAWLDEDHRRGEATLLDHYGAESPAEFFAVASERFFELPHLMKRGHPELHAALVEFYHQDPSQWLPR